MLAHAESLRTESNKLKGIAYLVEAQRETLSVPVDMEEINTGIGQIIMETAIVIRNIAMDLESDELNKKRKSKD